ncbi:MAG TPA: hypothetical protein VH601_03490, partial [Bryobacteraceae bacterium]
EFRRVEQHDRIAVDIDLFSVKPPPLSQIRYIRITSTDELDYKSFAVIQPQNLRVTAGSIRVRVYGLREEAPPIPSALRVPEGRTEDDQVAITTEKYA